MQKVETVPPIQTSPVQKTNTPTHTSDSVPFVACSSFLVRSSLLLKHIQPNLFLNILIILVNTWKFGGVSWSHQCCQHGSFMSQQRSKSHSKLKSSWHLELSIFSASSDIRNGHQVPLSRTQKMHCQHFQPYFHYSESSLDKTKCRDTFLHHIETSGSLIRN